MFTERITRAGLILALTLPLAAGAQMGPPEHGTDRPGKDLRSFASSRWQECSSSCASQKECWAYTFVAGSGGGTCWLKDGATATRPLNGAVSGIKVMGPVERGLDRPGEDLHSGIPSDDPPTCLRACQGEPRCWAWTWVKPKDKGKGACWLKGNSPAAVRNDCCFSGIRVVAATESVDGSSARRSEPSITTTHRITTPEAAVGLKPQSKPPGPTLTESAAKSGLMFQPNIIPFKLEVQLLSGGFEKWGDAITQDGLQNIRFRVQTIFAAADSVEWQVSDKPFLSGDPSDEVTSLIASGSAGKAPLKNESSVFDINFLKLIPPSATTSPRSYFVRVAGKDSDDHFVGGASGAVTITNQKAGDWGQNISLALIASVKGTQVTGVGLEKTTRGYLPSGSYGELSRPMLVTNEQFEIIGKSLQLAEYDQIKVNFLQDGAVQKSYSRKTSAVRTTSLSQDETGLTLLVPSLPSGDYLVQLELSNASTNHKSTTNSQAVYIFEPTYTIDATLHCLEETNDGLGTSDEPYVVLLAARTVACSSDNDGCGIQSFAENIGSFHEVDSGESRQCEIKNLALINSAYVSGGVDSLIMLIGIIEYDGENKWGFFKAEHLLVPHWMDGEHFSDEQDRKRGVDVLRSNLNNEMEDHISRENVYGDPSEIVGRLQELRFTEEDRRITWLGSTVTRNLTFKADGGEYMMSFQLKARELKH